MYLDSWVEHKLTRNKECDVYAKKSEKGKIVAFVLVVLEALGR